MKRPGFAVMDGWMDERQTRATLVSVTSFFTLASSQEKLEQSPKRDIEGMGVAEIKYGDSLCFVMHVATGLWLSYQAPDVKSARLGPLKRRVSRRAANRHNQINKWIGLRRADDYFLG